MMPYIAGMAKTARLELRVEPALKARLETEADRRGQKLTTFVERALESALRADEGLAASSRVVPTPQAEPDVRAGARPGAKPSEQSRPPAACPECGAVGRMHQRGCSKSK